MTAITGPGLPAMAWAERIGGGPRWTPADLVDLAGPRSQLVVLSAHPDDETIGAGRLLRAWSRAGGQAYAVLASAGEACFDAVADRPAGLAERRVAEWRAALGVLGVQAGPLLGIADGTLAQVEDVLTENLLTTLLQPAPGRRSDAELVLLAPHPDDPHPDHAALGRAAARVAAVLGVPVWSYPIWLTYWSDPATDLGAGLGTVATDAADEQAWAAAVRCFDSQLTEQVPGAGPVVPPELLAHHDRQLLLVAPGRGR